MYNKFKNHQYLSTISIYVIQKVTIKNEIYAVQWSKTYLQQSLKIDDEAKP